MNEPELTQLEAIWNYTYGRIEALGEGVNFYKDEQMLRRIVSDHNALLDGTCIHRKLLEQERNRHKRLVDAASGALDLMHYEGYTIHVVTELEDSLSELKKEGTDDE